MLDILHFERAEALLLLLFAIPVVWIGWKRLTGLSRIKKWTVCTARILLITLIAAAIAQPKWLDRGEGISIIMLIDRSRSISDQLGKMAIEYLQDAVKKSENKRPIDRIAIINIGSDARVVALPDISTIVESGSVVVNLEATNLADGLEKAYAIAPADTATRILLVSDGNENVGNALSVADKIAFNHIPIDFLQLKYEYESDVMFDRIAAPSIARRGQNVPVKMILRSLKETSGTLHLTLGGEPIDLDSESEGTGRRLMLEEGVNAFPVTLLMDQQGAQRIVADFRPDYPEDDLRTNNNIAEAVTIVQGEGRILLVQESPEETTHLLQAIDEAQIEVEIVSPLDISRDLIMLSGYDSIILPNIPAHAFPPDTLETLRRYVHDIGGGLVMIGGPDSFGAGGYIDTPLEKAMPIKFDPPDIERMPKGALVCIMHSCEIPQGNYWGAKCAKAAIDALSRLDMAGVIDYNWNGGGFQGCQWEFPLQDLSNKAAAHAAIDKMPMGDMPDFNPAMVMAHKALSELTNVSQKHVIIVSDGDPAPPTPGLIQKYKDAGISVSTVVAGGHGMGGNSSLTMKRIAKQTGGKYHNPGNNFSLMPQIFMKEAIKVKRSLIVEGETFTASHNLTARPGPFRGRWQALPTFTGYVLTVGREGVSPEIVTSKGDPLFSSWQYGMGKTAAFTSDATARWGDAWTSWNEYKGFWEQTIRWSMRPAAPSNVEVAVTLDGQTAKVSARILTSDGKYATFGKMEGSVITPDMHEQEITLHQTGPGQGAAEFRADRSGSWLVTLMYHDAEAGTMRTIQAGLSIPYSQEYRAVKDNTPLLQQLAARTGGRQLPTDPSQAELFEREGLEVPMSMTDMWTLIAVLAASLLLFDVASRRLAFDGVAARRRWHSLWNRKDITAEQSIGRLRSKREEVQQTRTGAGGGADVAAETRRAAKEASGSRFESQEGANTSESVEDMTSADATSADESLMRTKRPTRTQPAASEGDEGEPMSRLLAAKKRAQRESKSDPDKEDGGNTNASG